MNEHIVSECFTYFQAGDRRPGGGTHLRPGSGSPQSLSHQPSHLRGSWGRRCGFRGDLGWPVSDKSPPWVGPVDTVAGPVPAAPSPHVPFGPPSGHPSSFTQAAGLQKDTATSLTPRPLLSKSDQGTALSGSTSARPQAFSSTYSVPGTGVTTVSSTVAQFTRGSHPSGDHKQRA